MNFINHSPDGMSHNPLPEPSLYEELFYDKEVEVDDMDNEIERYEKDF